ncbi:hypothetical protein, partial [Candidatus Ichthyocystis hellenicum]|uniref:hypothetical protein n=1 Tax=Candidatus Ichthyocystis hellenicum TaxID=1561003 RepID=UPI0015855E6B
IVGSVPQTRAISESKISGSGSEATGEGTTLGGGIVVASPDGAGSSLPPVTETVTQRCVISESKISGDSSKCAEGTESGSSAIDLTRRLVVSLPRLKFQHELSSQPESSLSPVDTVPRRRLISESNISGGSSKCAEGTESVSSTAALTNSPVISSTQLRSELSSQSETQLRSLLLFEGKDDQPSRRFVRLLSYGDQSANLSDVAVYASGEPPSDYSDFGSLVGELSPVDLFPPSVLFAPLSQSTSEADPGSQSQYEMQLGSLSGECFSSISAHGSVSALEGDASDFGALVGELSPVDLSPPSILFAPLSQSTSEADTGYKYQYEMQLGSLFGECFSSISTHGSVSTLEGDASNLRVLEDGSSSSESRSAPKLCEDVYSPFVTQLVMGHLEESTGDSVVAGPSSSSPVSADMRGGRGGSSSSLQGGVQRRGRKRKRNE